MTDRAKIKEFLERLYCARLNGDVEAIGALFTADAAFTILGASRGYPVSIVANGAANIRETLALLIRISKIRNYKLLSMIVEGSNAAVHWEATVLSRVIVGPVFTEFVDIIRLSREHIASYTELFAHQAVPDAPARLSAPNAIKLN